MIEIDAVFTPVQKIHYSVEVVRVGQRTDLDKMTLEVKTNGSILSKRCYVLRRMYLNLTSISSIEIKKLLNLNS